MKSRFFFILSIFLIFNTDTNGEYLRIIETHPRGKFNEKFISDYKHAIRHRKKYDLFRQKLEEEIIKLQKFDEKILNKAILRLEADLDQIRTSKDIKQLITLTESLRELYLQIPQKFYNEISAKIGLSLLQSIFNIIQLSPDSNHAIELFKKAFPAGRYISDLNRLIKTPGFSEVLYNIIKLTDLNQLTSLKTYPTEKLNEISGFLYEIKFALKLMEKNFQVLAFEPILYSDGERSEYDIFTDIGIFEIKRSDRHEPERMEQLEKEFRIAQTNKLNYIYCTINPQEGEDSIRCAINGTECNLDWPSFLKEAREIQRQASAAAEACDEDAPVEEAWVEVKPRRRSR